MHENSLLKVKPARPLFVDALSRILKEKQKEAPDRFAEPIVAA